MSLDDITGAASKGAVEGALQWTKDQIVALAKKFKNRELAFINDEETINLVRRLRKDEELDAYKNYLEDRDLLLMCQMGLTLRRLNKEKKHKEIADLRTKIYRKHGVEMLHAAQAVQEGLVSTLISNLWENSVSNADIKKVVNGALSDVNQYICFVKSEDNPVHLARTIKARLDANAPLVFVMCGIKSASEVAKNSLKNMEDDLHDYKIITKFKKSKATILFLNKVVYEIFED